VHLYEEREVDQEELFDHVVLEEAVHLPVGEEHDRLAWIAEHPERSVFVGGDATLRPDSLVSAVAGSHLFNGAVLHAVHRDRADLAPS
jgi:hypothetical protein